MKQILTTLLFVSVLGCGHAPLDPHDAGVCFVDPGFTSGRVWRPCEEPVQVRADGKSCKVRILDRIEFHSPDEPDVMSCSDCYGDLKGDCR